MTLRFPVDNLPENMQAWRRALENTLDIADSAQTNARSIISGTRQSIASNYGLGSRLEGAVGNISDKVYSQLGNYQGSPASAVTLQRAWTNVAGILTLTSPNFVSNISLAVAGAYDYAISGGTTGATYSTWNRISVSGAFTAQKYVYPANFSQILFSAQNVPPNTNISMRMQAWGYVKNTNGTYVNGTLSTATVVRISAALRAIALV